MFEVEIAAGGTGIFRMDVEIYIEGHRYRYPTQTIVCGDRPASAACTPEKPVLWCEARRPSII
jgi:hypothetical protein